MRASFENDFYYTIFSVHMSISISTHKELKVLQEAYSLKAACKFLGFLALNQVKQ